MSSSLSIRSLRSDTTEPLHQLKLLSALRSGDPALIHPFLAEIGKERRKSVDGDINTGAAALHLAIRCASVDTVQLLLCHRAISPNGVHPPGSGTTPLHLAAFLGRADIVGVLLDQAGIDDTLRDNNGKTCKDVAKVKEVIQILQGAYSLSVFVPSSPTPPLDSRSFLNASYRSLLRSYILSPMDASPNTALVTLLESPRARGVDLSYLDDASGTSLLHEAARRKNLRLVELAVRAGASVFVRDRRGKMAYEGTGKDDHVRVFLRQFANHDASLIEVPSSEPPVMKGYLNKYTNVAKGYNTRWFVLKDGVFTYYRHQEDEDIASRGAIAMKTAILKLSPGGDKTRFEIHSTPSRGHATGQKWYMRANHHVEAAGWTQALGKSIEWARRDEQLLRKSGESDLNALKPKSVRSSFQSAMSMRRMDVGTRRGGSQSSFIGIADESMEDGPPPETSKAAKSRSTSDNEEHNDNSSASVLTQSPPHNGTFDLQGNSAAAQMELTAQLLSNLALPPDAAPRTQELRTALKESFAIVQTMIDEYVQMAKDREEWWKSQLQRERERQTVWEESLQTVVREGEVLERELRIRSRKRGSRFFDVGINDIGGGTLRQRPMTMALVSPVLEEPYISPPVRPAPITIDVSPPGEVDGLSTSTVPSSPASAGVTPTAQCMPRHDQEDEDAIDTDEEDEFFDAIEANALPNLVVSQLLSSPMHAVPALSFMNGEHFAGYKNLRARLPIGSDNRPSTSLWSVLKHSIGKDLTRISFPVMFNEPTSMLQRMAEDMEFSECLDIAARERDPHRRLAFVAAFAMSNYSSTIGRIAKPFNPMLSETFEYVRLDKEYRYISEQVSHHPPISACWAESPYWHYYGEVDAQNKFMGKSFEIRPTGVAHAELLLPEEWAPDYPKCTAAGIQGKVVEHFSWKKVTTNVSGFILGSPTIDHYGDMIVTNHRTGDQCVLTFKPRGWRGKDAYEISGVVRDADGEVTHEVAGRWNSQLICRAVGTGSGFLHPDATVSGPSSPNYAAEYILLWRNSEKPTTPFNLTPFAITLNDCPDKTLRPYLCPTDCRLRPDQRAFEMGKYEFANGLKMQQEERQRATRRAREEGRAPPHRPRWFRAETDGDTGERVWAPSRAGDRLEYWMERERVWEKGGRQPWKNVEPIFIEDAV
ncbi:Oxysterol-binding protein-domain-containing protein [Suillus subalutaceus]|uniref:Oxysterol-binding protein-domain-containing protein n=1 Tax=Suillus subalutaceus TaxID=48586 RepID=UPI001B865A55|nr:Oxysterol-binding protein-domain-containing protein [Suillus subalutaceus]KAG1835395.1 Oxysterol-binding protein-domain-containing protein [Suillus subalutaceus]